MKLLERYKVLAVVALLAFALGSYVANETGRRSERPLLRWLSVAAKWGLRAMVFLEPAPPELEPSYQTRIGDDGFQVLDHSRSL